MQLQKPYRRGEYAACLRFYLDAGIPIYDLITALLASEQVSQLQLQLVLAGVQARRACTVRLAG
jgi:hypothetical protein